ncbi:hypothetical protein [Rhodococcus sp. IEGM 1307]|uniref:hypothetical protein n=1 Tax=Rhodococcus sp. IEGM 1307 TaxID=3047091 RepID=UPI0024B64BAE|nr:hypothetical protein [Rhodococcus sp. IEGM 1307]MDI9979341.1 hypothetical protein [Rhodococcus sp. IEGM 1307]
MSRKTTDIMTAHPGYTGARTKGGRTTTEVVLAYLANPQMHHHAAVAIRASGDLGRIGGDALDDPVADVADEKTTAIEGRVTHRLTRVRERDPKLRANKIKEALKNSAPLPVRSARSTSHVHMGTSGADTSTSTTLFHCTLQVLSRTHSMISFWSAQTATSCCTAA